MKEKIFETASGKTHYWTNHLFLDRKTLVMLPGLTADHHLFDKQIEAFEKDYNLFTWDAPGHAASRHFELNFSLMDKAVCDFFSYYALLHSDHREKNPRRRTGSGERSSWIQRLYEKSEIQAGSVCLVK